MPVACQEQIISNSNKPKARDSSEQAKLVEEKVADDPTIAADQQPPALKGRIEAQRQILLTVDGPGVLQETRLSQIKQVHTIEKDARQWCRCS